MIARRLHQFWDTGAPPDAVSKLMETWRSFNPDWEYRLWTDATAEPLLESFGPHVAAAFRQSRMPAMRADIARYAILHRHGGVYADADLTCLRALDQVVAADAELVFFKGWNGAWRNDFMAATAGAQLMADFIEHAADNVARRISNNVWQVTGPGMTTPLIQAQIERGDVRIQTFMFHDVKGKILQFNHDLDYRSNGLHWSKVQETESIFR